MAEQEDMSQKQVNDALQDIRDTIEDDGKQPAADVLDLTEIVEEEGEVSDKSKAEEVKKENPEEEVKEKSDIIEEIDSVDSAADKKNDSVAKEESASNVAQDAGVEQEVSSEVAEISEEKKGLITKKVLSESQETLRDFIKVAEKSNIDGLPLRSGGTVEDLVLELIKPYLSVWLNDNLPAIVKNAVEKEIKKLIPQDD